MYACMYLCAYVCMKSEIYLYYIPNIKGIWIYHAVFIVLQLP